MKPQVHSEPERETLSGLVERVTFHSPDSGFCVLRVKVRGHRDLVTVLGSAATVQAGEYIHASGRWENNRDHGLQFKAAFMRSSLPTTLDGIEKYLGSGLIKGIGPHFAKRLVAEFGEGVFDLIEDNPRTTWSISRMWIIGLPPEHHVPTEPGLVGFIRRDGEPGWSASDPPDGDHAVDAPVQIMSTRHMAHPATGTSRTQQQPKDRPIFRCRPDRDSGIPICRERRAWAWDTPRARFQEKERPGIPRRRDIWTPMGMTKPTPTGMGGCIGICAWGTIWAAAWAAATAHMTWVVISGVRTRPPGSWWVATEGGSASGPPACCPWPRWPAMPTPSSGSCLWS